MKNQVLQAIVTKYIPMTNTKGARIKATAAAGSLTVSLSKLDGDDGRKDAITRNDAQHWEVARLLCEKFKWNVSLQTGALPNGDYVQVMTTRPAVPFYRDGRVIHVDGKGAIYVERLTDANGNCPLAPWQVDNVATQVCDVLSDGLITIPATLGDVK